MGIGFGIGNNSWYKGKGSVVDPYSDLFAYYRFNDNVADQRGLYNGSWVGSSSYLAGKSGNAMANNGNTANYVSIADADAFSFTDGDNDVPFTISFWHYASDASEQIIANKIGASTNREWLIDSFSTSMRFRLYNQDGGTTNFIGRDSSFTRTNDTWYHWVITYDGGGLDSGIKFYLDGSLNSSSSNSGGTYVKTANLGQPVVVGRFNDLALLPLNGRIDGLGFWSKELDASEVSDIYTEQNAGNELI